MPRLSIDMSVKEHQQLKALAALKGVSIKQYVLERTIGDAPDMSGLSEQQSLHILQSFLEERIAQIDDGKIIQIGQGELLPQIKSRAKSQNG